MAAGDTSVGSTPCCSTCPPWAGSTSTSQASSDPCARSKRLSVRFVPNSAKRLHVRGACCKVIHRPSWVRFGVGFGASRLMLSVLRCTQKTLIHRPQTQPLGRIGRPKNAKSPIAGASLKDCWRERCYTATSVLQWQCHKRQTGPEGGISGTGSGLRTEEPQGKRRSSH